MFRTQGLEKFGWELGELLKEVEGLEERKNNYINQVNSFRNGMASPKEMESTMYSMAESMNNLNDEIRDAQYIYTMAVNHFETSNSTNLDLDIGADEELLEKIVDNGFEVVKSPAGAKYEKSATENEIAYQSFIESYGTPEFLDDQLTKGEQIKQIIDTIEERYDEIKGEACEYRSKFLYENLDTTLPGAMLDIMDGYVEASFDQQIESKRAEQIRKNPKDSYIGGFDSNEGIESLEEARRNVREKTPRGKVANQGPSEEEIEENNERIKRKREEVRNRESRGIH